MGARTERRDFAKRGMRSDIEARDEIHTSLMFSASLPTERSCWNSEQGARFLGATENVSMSVDEAAGPSSGRRSHQPTDRPTVYSLRSRSEAFF